MTLHQPRQRATRPGSGAAEGVTVDHRVRPPRRSARHSMKAYLYVAPAFLVFAAFLGAPVVQTVQYSFYDWDGLGKATVAGLSNYVAVFDDERLLRLLPARGGADAVLRGGTGPHRAVPQALISRAHAMRSMSFFRTVLFLPQVIATVVVATIWISIYSHDGLLNQTLRLVGLGSLSRVWLGDHTLRPARDRPGRHLAQHRPVPGALPVRHAATSPPELFEAARLDGAGPVREFFAITLPSLRGQIAVALTLTVVSALKTFDLVFITTRGGPGNATTVPAFEVYNRAFNTGQVGLGLGDRRRPHGPHLRADRVDQPHRPTGGPSVTSPAAKGRQLADPGRLRRIRLDPVCSASCCRSVTPARPELRRVHGSLTPSTCTTTGGVESRPLLQLPGLERDRHRRGRRPQRLLARSPATRSRRMRFRGSTGALLPVSARADPADGGVRSSRCTSTCATSGSPTPTGR